MFLYLGEVVEAIDVHTFFENPANERTQRFIDGEATVSQDGTQDATGSETAIRRHAVPDPVGIVFQVCGATATRLAHGSEIRTTHSTLSLLGRLYSPPPAA